MSAKRQRGTLILELVAYLACGLLVLSCVAKFSEYLEKSHDIYKGFQDSRSQQIRVYKEGP